MPYLASHSSVGCAATTSRKRRTTRDELRQAAAHRLQHLDVGREIRIRRLAAVPRHDDGVAVDAGEYSFAKVDDAVEVAAVVDVGEGVRAGEEHVARVDDVAAAQEHGDVARRVRRRHVHELEALLREIHLDAVVERDGGRAAGGNAG